MQKQAHAGTQWPGKNTDTKIYYNSEDINELSAIKMSPHSDVRYRISSMATDWIGEKTKQKKPPNCSHLRCARSVCVEQSDKDISSLEHNDSLKQRQ